MEANRRILLAGDEQLTSSEFRSLLTWAGFTAVVLNKDASIVAQVAESTPELLLIDITCNPSTTRELLSLLERTGVTIPVILLGEGGPMERALALDRGADDYINKPFHETELISRIRAVLRRIQRQEQLLDVSYRLTCNDLAIDRLAKRAWLSNEEVVLTPKAFAVLEYLMTHADQLITRDMLLDAVWGWEYPAGIRAVDTRIFELRKALQDTRAHPRYIETVSGMGYRFIGSVQALL
ncbi:MAG: response regulator transcription factor [Anaerolineae bacterium]|nr:response regulator transcription factor [Anaerolineae bacterium]